MFKIGIVDDCLSQISSIRLTIKENWPVKYKEQLSFKTYDLFETEELIDVLYKEIINDINNNIINCLIIDYKIITNTINVKGTELYQRLKTLLFKFPVIILTEKVEDSLVPSYMDADKVYAKKEFLKIRELYSKEKVRNIFENIKKYNENIVRINTKISTLRKQYFIDDVNQDQLMELYRLEDELSEYIPSDSTSLSSSFVDDLNKIVDLIKVAENME